MSAGHSGPPTRIPVGVRLCVPSFGGNRGRSIFRTRNLSMNGQEAVLFPVSLSLSISPQEVDAGAALTLKAVAECPEDYDLSGDQISFRDAAGREIGRGAPPLPPEKG